MPDLLSLLEVVAERGESRGASEVLRRAVSDITAKTSARPPRRRRKALALVLATAAIVVVGIVVANSRGDRGTEVRTSSPETSAGALRTQESGHVIWANRDGVVVADPQSGSQEVLVEGVSTCGVVRVGDYAFAGRPGLRIDTRDLTVRRLGMSGCAFADTGDALYVVLSAETTATGTTTEIERVDRDGTRLGGPWTVPSGHVLSTPNRAVAGGVLVETRENSNNHTLSVWNPDTGEVTPIGPARWVVDTFTSDDGENTLLAYIAAGCETAGCAVMIAELPNGDTTRVEAPAGSSSYFGGGAFSPDGTELAVFASHPPPENVDPGVDLVIVDVEAGSAARIDDSTVTVGEPYGFATWSPDGRWLFFGGLSDDLRAHFRGSADAVVLGLPSEYTTVAVATPGA
jgi:hypothetical protein